MLRKAALAAGLLAFALAAADARATVTPVVGPDSGLAVPRFVSLDSESANGRRRPDANAQIDWIYVARDLPLRVTAESGPWRRVEDPDGTEVWMHTSSLVNDKTVFVRGTRRPEAILRTNPRNDARTVAILEQGVIGRVTDCRDGWVRIGVGPHNGWVRKDAVWGATDCGA